jgi:hypothetical protein
MPDTLICYPGSIEKLKLLGATYYLLTYPNCQIRLFGYLVIWVCGNKVKNCMVSPSEAPLSVCGVLKLVGTRPFLSLTFIQ